MRMAPKNAIFTQNFAMSVTPDLERCYSSDLLNVSGKINLRFLCALFLFIVAASFACQKCHCVCACVCVCVVTGSSSK